MQVRTLSETVIFTVALFCASIALAAGGPEERPSPARPAIASSNLPLVTVSFGPENVMDGKSTSVWCEGVPGDGVGEWVAIYLGKGSNLGGPQDFSLAIQRGYTVDYEGYNANGKPTRIRVELFDDAAVIASSEVAVEHSFSDVDFKNVRAAKGDVWLKVTILQVQTGTRSKATCVGEIRPNFSKANPSNVREFAARVCLLINKPKTYETNKELKALVQKIKKYFVYQYEPGTAPQCSLEFFRVLSDTDFELHGIEEGDAASLLRFRKSGIMWDLVSQSHFVLFD